MTGILYGVFRTDNYGDVELWASFKERKEAFKWIGTSRFHEKYEVKVISESKENLEYLYHD